MPTKTKKQTKDPDLGLAVAYDYKRQIEKTALRLYMHVMMIVGMILALIGLVAYEPVPKVLYLALAVFGAFVIVTGWFLDQRIKNMVN